MEGPGGHILIEAAEVGIIDFFEAHLPTELLADHLGEGGFTGADVASDEDKAFGGFSHRRYP